MKIIDIDINLTFYISCVTYSTFLLSDVVILHPLLYLALKLKHTSIQCTPLICTAFGHDSEVHISEACLLAKLTYRLRQAASVMNAHSIKTLHETTNIQVHNRSQIYRLIVFHETVHYAQSRMVSAYTTLITSKEVSHCFLQ